MSPFPLMRGCQTSRTVGVLLTALGSPENLEEMEEYLLNIRRGRPPSPELVKEMQRRYALAGGKSPLLAITQKQGESLHRALEQSGKNFNVYIGMRHWHPFIQSVIEKIVKDRVQRLVVLPLTPYESKYSVGAYHQAVKEALKVAGADLQVSYIKSWHDHPRLIETYAEFIRERLPNFRSPELVFTAHSLPKRIVEEKDPYPRQLQTTANLVAEKLGIKTWHFAYQSQGKSEEPWLGPTVEEVLTSLAERKVREVLLSPIGFVSDHMEILYDLDLHMKDFAAGKGIRLERTQSPNTHPGFIQTLASVVTQAAR